MPENIMQSFFNVCRNDNTSQHKVRSDIVILRRARESNTKNIAQSNVTWLFIQIKVTFWS